MLPAIPGYLISDNVRHRSDVVRTILQCELPRWLSPPTYVAPWLKCGGRRCKIQPMKRLVSLLALAVSLLAQQPGGRGVPEPKNLKLLSPKSDIMFIMRSFNDALGVQCTYCHVQNDFAADSNPKKDIARKMISM